MIKRGPIAITFDEFTKHYLIRNFVDTNGKPKHTRLIKNMIYKFAEELNEKYKFDIFKCSECGIAEWNGKKIVMELDHINRITNDSRIKNLRPLCPNCHSQTLGYKNRKLSINNYVRKLKNNGKDVFCRIH